MADDRKQIGHIGEQAAARFLKRHGYTIVEHNYRCRAGEVDLIALDGSVVVFVEVKTRADPDEAAPFEAVTLPKQQRITRAAQYYLSTHRLFDRDVRFDVVGVWWDGRTARCELVRAAFEA
jgi:putative endonuclease